MNRYKYSILIVVVSILLTTSCSQTSGIPEDDYLYSGIKDISYASHLPRRTFNPDEKGVITAFANTYNAVSDILKGDATGMGQLQQIDSLLTSEQKDSIALRIRQDEETYEKVRSEVEGALSWAPDGSLMGSSKYKHPFTPRVWIWNKYVNSTSRFGKWMFNNFSSTPKLMSACAPEIRANVAKNTLRNFGYFQGTARYEIIPQKNPRKQKVSYQVIPGRLWHFDNIDYIGFKGIADSLVRKKMNEACFHTGDPFSAAALSDERKRLRDLLRNNGYYDVMENHITFRADTLQKPYEVQLQVIPNIPDSLMRQYYLGDTRITIYDQDETNITDSIGHKQMRMLFSGGKARTEKKYPQSPLRLRAMYPYLFYKKGRLYRKDLMEKVQERLALMGVFSSLQMDFAKRDSDTLDIYITGHLDKQYNSEFEGRVAFKSNGQIGPGASYRIDKKNAFRGAETLSFGVMGSYEWQTGANMNGNNSVLNSWQLGADLTLTYPRFILFGLTTDINSRLRSTTYFKVDAKWQNRSGYFSRFNIGVGATWTFQTKHNMTHELTPIKLQYDHLLSTTNAFNVIVSRNPALYNSMRDQFVPSLEYKFSWVTPTIRHGKGIITNRRTTSSVDINFKEAGNFTSCIYAIAGKPFAERDKELFKVPFAQFVKGSLDYVLNYHITDRQTLAVRSYLGVLFTYGNSTEAPYSDLFTAGGANSIRAFGVRSIGPGSYHPAEAAYSYLNQMGDLRFEANIEYRFPIIAQLYGAVFLDAGNVWLLKDDPDRPGGKFQFKNLGKELALGTGIGIRYDLEILVVRFDVGVGIHAPYDTGKSGYYNMTSFGKSLGYHFAIGYPF